MSCVREKIYRPLFCAPRTSTTTHYLPYKLCVKSKKAASCLTIPKTQQFQSTVSSSSYATYRVLTYFLSVVVSPPLMFSCWRQWKVLKNAILERYLLCCSFRWKAFKTARVASSSEIPCCAVVSADEPASELLFSRSSLDNPALQIEPVSKSTSFCSGCKRELQTASTKQPSNSSSISQIQFAFSRRPSTSYFWIERQTFLGTKLNWLHNILVNPISDPIPSLKTFLVSSPYCKKREQKHNGLSYYHYHRIK